MSFANKISYSGYHKFDEVISCLNKSCQRNDLELALAAAIEFKEYPELLKKHMILTCCNSIPNLLLIHDIYKSTSSLESLFPYIELMCNHLKCQEHIWAFRIACTRKDNFEPISSDDDILTLSTKLKTCINSKNEKQFVQYYRNKYPAFEINKLYNFTSKNKYFLMALIAYDTQEYIHINYYSPSPTYSFESIKPFEKYPSYVYDRNVKSSPPNQRTMKYQIHNLVLLPCNPPTTIEIKAKKLFVTTNKPIEQYLIPNVKCVSEEKSDNTYDLVDSLSTMFSKPVQLIRTNISAPNSNNTIKTYYLDLDDSNSFKYMLIGPFALATDFENILYADLLRRLFLECSFNYESVGITPQNYYLIYDNVIPIDARCTTVKSNAVENNVIVYDGSLYRYRHEYIYEMKPTELILLFEFLLFRKIVGVETYCDDLIYYRNDQNDIIMASINDAVKFKDSDHIFTECLNEDLCNTYSEKLNSIWKYLRKDIKKWKKELDKTECNNKEFIVNVLEKYSDIGHWIW